METFGFQWHLTDRCNQRCAHCYQERWEPGAELGLPDWRAMGDGIFAALADRQVSVNLTGGEPLLLSDLPDLVDHLHSKPNLDEVWVITNGTLSPKQPLARLASQDRLTGFKVSVESADESLNDEVRGPGNLARVTHNLASFIETGKQVVLMVTLGSHNLATIEQTLSWARQQGVTGVIFERFVPLGHGRTMAEQVLTEAQWREAGAAIAGCAGETLTEEELACLRAFWICFAADGGTLHGARCALGAESMALMPDGIVYPCRRLPEPIGNALSEPFDAILERLARRVPLTGGGCAASIRALDRDE